MRPDSSYKEVINKLAVTRGYGVATYDVHEITNNDNTSEREYVNLLSLNINGLNKKFSNGDLADLYAFIHKHSLSGKRRKRVCDCLCMSVHTRKTCFESTCKVLKDSTRVHENSSCLCMSVHTSMPMRYDDDRSNPTVSVGPALRKRRAMKSSESVVTYVVMVRSGSDRMWIRS